MKQVIIFSICFLILTATAQAAPAYFSQINALNLPNNANGNGVIVAVLDSGVDIDHPDLKNNIWTNTREIPNDGIDNDNNGYIDDVNGWDFTVTSTPIGRNDPRPKFEDGYISEGISHGTAIAGFIAAQVDGNYDTAGLAQRAKIMPLRVLTAIGEGDTESVAKAIKYAVDNGAKVINLSFVGYDEAPELAKAVQDAYDRGAVIVAAAGNGNASSTSGINLKDEPAYPVCYGNSANGKNLLAVSSVGSNNQKSAFANYGGGCINISTPGENLVGLAYESSTKIGYEDGYAAWSGTSFSAALVSGASALLKSFKPSLTPSQIIKSLVKSAGSLSIANPNLQPTDLGGLLDVRKALDYNMSSYKPRLVKLAKYATIYYVDEENIRHVFSSKAVYSSWFAGLKKTPIIQTITQSEFDDLKNGSVVTARPGILVKFKGSAMVYELLNGNKLCRLGNSAAGQALFGKNWQKKIITLSSAELNDYNIDVNCRLNADSQLPMINSIELIPLP